MKITQTVLLLLLFTNFLPNVFAQRKTTAKDPDKGLKEYYKDYFSIGVAVTPRAFKTDEAPFILKNFNTITAENAMKMGPIHPEENRYFWDHADEIVEFGQKNKLQVRGHVLCWHEQTPPWMFVDKEGKRVSKEVLLERLREHITTVVTRYKGKIFAWDVVNEAISDNPDEFIRDSPWYQICGEDYIVKAFEYAHAADPNARLFYNDYNTERPEKVERVYRLMAMLKEKGVPVHGLGLQGHWSIFEPSEKELRDALTKYATLGLEIHITELDMSVHPWEKFNRERRPDESDVFTAELEQKQVQQYGMAFKVFREFRDVISNVTFWNISDRHSWLDNYPVRGRKNYPLLFDKDLKPKKAFWEVVRF